LKTVFERRASTILHNLSSTDPDQEPVYLIPANACPVVPLALLTAGRTIEFIDIDPTSLCMDETLALERVLASSKPYVGGIVFIRTYGMHRDMTGFFEIVKAVRQEILIVDDRCAEPPEPDCGRVDSEGADIVLYSTGYAKYCDLAYGGFAHLKPDVPYAPTERMYDPEKLNEVNRLFRRHRAAALQIRLPAVDAQCSWSESKWLDTRPPETGWAEYREAMLQLKRRIGRRKAAINEIYREIIPEHLQLPEAFHTWRFQIRVPDSQKLLACIRAAGLLASDHYFPCSRLFSGQYHAETEALYADIVNLFNDDYTTEAEAEKTAGVIRRHAENL
jgi:hypothetical protein